VPVTADPTFPLGIVELSAPEATPDIVKTWLELSLSSSLSSILSTPLFATDKTRLELAVPPIATDDAWVWLVAAGAAFNDMLIVLAVALSVVPSETLNVKLSSLSELAVGV